MTTAALKEINHLKAHTSQITQINVPEDISTFFTSSRDKKVFQWHSQDFRLKKSFEDSKHHVNAIAYSNENLITVGADSILRFYGKALKKIKAHEKEITTVTINNYDNKIITGSLDNTIALWNTKGEEINRMNNNAWVTCSSFLPNKDSVVIGSDDGTLKVWDIDSGKVINTYYAGGLKKITGLGPVTALSVTADGTYVAYGGRDCEVYIMHLERGECIRTFKTEGSITSLAFAVTEPIIAVGTKNHLYLWDVVGDKILSKISTAEYGSGVFCSALAWVRNELLVGLSNGELKVYEFSRSEIN